ncbi:transglutaminase-like domain-containing protein [Humisphaera borealis]|uniref:Transglutaminase domain-containing protein n=1 Tax=Humisphaera borealis TaxID=2807512 RepID=A0A7M2WRH4_9BACT|nr:transglutaminase domain-containing protein [Humisphaera borealis]QOV88076.1 transglutaminase domain-containing protein [Humisphaera borealis]
MSSDTGGASLFWTSDEPEIAAARSEAASGRLLEAEAILRRLPGSIAAQEGLQVLRWIRRDYGLDEGQIVAKLRESIPDVTAADLARWRTEGVLQHRVIDGRQAYFRAEPANLFRFCEEAKRRKVLPADSPGGWTLEQHLERVIAQVEATGKASVVPIRQEVDLELTVPPGTPGLVAGAIVRAWLPFPQEYRQQQAVRLVSSSPAVAFVAPTATPQRSVYLEHRVRSADEPVRFAATMAFTTSAYCPLLAKTSARDDRPTEADLTERRPHVVFSQPIRAATADAVGAEREPLERARRIFRWVCANIAYNAEEDYGIVPSLVERAISRRRGDCGVQALLFIAMCRCAGVPARWQSGWQTQRVRWNMHDWCECYVEPCGWIPVDPSYGLRASDDLRIREFFFGGMDAYRLIVNVDYGRPLVPAKPSLRSEPLDFQRGEIEIDGNNLYFDQWNSKFRPRWLDEEP